MLRLQLLVCTTVHGIYGRGVHLMHVVVASPWYLWQFKMREITYLYIIIYIPVQFVALTAVGIYDSSRCGRTVHLLHVVVVSRWYLWQFEVREIPYYIL